MMIFDYCGCKCRLVSRVYKLEVVVLTKLDSDTIVELVKISFNVHELDTNPWVNIYGMIDGVVVVVVVSVSIDNYNYNLIVFQCNELITNCCQCCCCCLYKLIM